MTQEGFKRKLTAILSADVVGYTGLALSYYFLGREKEARAAVKEAHKLNPEKNKTIEKEDR